MKRLIKGLFLSVIGLATVGLIGCEKEAHVHSYTAVVTAPTCMRSGYTTYTCSCGESYEGEKTAPLGHYGGEATCQREAVCEDCGYEYGEFGDHVFENAYCVECGEYEGSMDLAYSLNEDENSYSLLNAGVCISEEISIPSFYMDKPVTAVADYALFEYNSIKKIRLPKTVTNVGAFAFSSCRLLEEIKIDAGNTAFKVVDNVLYTADGKVLIVYANAKKATTFEVPEGVEVIADGAFYGAEKLTEIALPASVKKIGDYAFAWCGALMNINIPEGVESIGEKAFLRSGTVSKSSSGDLQFLGDENNPYVYAVGIDESAVTYTLPAQTKIVDASIFSNCSFLTSIKAEEGNAFYKEINGNLYTADGTKLIRYATGNNASSFAVPETVTDIGESAFSGCKKLQKIDIHDGVKTVGRNAFEGCDNLTVYSESKTIPNSWDKNWNSSYCSVAYGYGMNDGVFISNDKTAVKDAELSLNTPTVSGGTVSSFTVEYQKIGNKNWETVDVAGGKKMPTGTAGWYNVRYTIVGTLADHSILDGAFVHTLYIKDPSVAFDFEGNNPLKDATYYYAGATNGSARYQIVSLGNNNRGFRILNVGESWEGIFYEEYKTLGKICTGIRLRIYTSAPINYKCSILTSGTSWENSEVLLEAGWNDVKIDLADFSSIKGMTFKQSVNMPLIILDDIHYLEK